MKKSVREPRQERSIEKKKRIVDAGYELFSEVGYYGTNTAEIAKRAGVSTGIVYGYFKDKKDILICVLELYLNEVYEPISAMLDKLTSPVDYEKVIPHVLEATIKTHKKKYKIHEALHSLAGSDSEVNAEFIALEDKLTTRIYERLAALGENTENLKEKIHFAMGTIQDYCHEYVFDKHEYIDYSVLEKMVVTAITHLFSRMK